MRLSLTLVPDSSAPSRARTAVRAFSLGLAPARLADAQLVLSELVTVAVQHAREDTLRVQLELLPGGRLRGEVAGAVPPAREDNVGLQVVHELVSDWGVAGDPDRLWFVLGPAAA
jgi:hypothetical protein